MPEGAPRSRRGPTQPVPSLGLQGRSTWTMPAENDQAGALTRRALLGSGFAAGAALALVPWWAQAGCARRGPCRNRRTAVRRARRVRRPSSHRRWCGGPRGARPRPGAGRRSSTRPSRSSSSTTPPSTTAPATGRARCARSTSPRPPTATATSRTTSSSIRTASSTKGRWARDYPAGAAPDGQDGRGWSVRGGHARGHNPRTIGIALLGDYTRAVPTDAALASMLGLLVWKSARWNLDPTGASTYVNVQGGSETFPNIVAHGQIRATQCPGAHLNALLPALRARHRESARAALRFHRPRMTEPAPASGAAGGPSCCSRSGSPAICSCCSSPSCSCCSASGSSTATTRSTTKDAVAKAKYAAPAPALGAPGSEPATGAARGSNRPLRRGRRSAPAQPGARRRWRLRRAHAARPRRRHRSGGRSRLGPAQRRRPQHGRCSIRRQAR